MAKQIKANDLFESEDIFKGIRESAEKTIVTIDKLNAEFKQTAEGLKNTIGNADLGSTKGINDFTKATTQANALQKEAAELAKLRAEAEKQAAIAQREQSKAQEQAIKTAQAEAKAKDQAAKAAENAAKAAANEASSYKQLEKSTRELKNQSKELGAQLLMLKESGKENSDEFKSVQSQYEKVTQSAIEADAALKELDYTVGDSFRNVGNYKDALNGLDQEAVQLENAHDNLNATFEQVYGELQPLTTRMGEAEDRLYELGLAGQQATQEYQDLLQMVGNYRRTQIETDLVVDAAATTLGQKMGGSLQFVAGAFSAVQGGLAEFGVVNEDVEQAILKVQSAMAISDGIKTMRESVASLSQTYGEFKKMIISAASKMGLMTTAKEVDTAVTVGQTTATQGATVATSGLGKAMKALPIVALIAGLAALSAAVYAYFSSQKELTARQQAFNETLDDYKQAQAGAIQTTMEVGNAFKMAKKGVISKDEALKKYNETLGDSFGRATNLNEAEKLFRSKTKAYIESVGLRAQADALFRRAAESTAEATAMEIENEKTIVNIRKGMGAYGFKKKLIAEIQKESEEMKAKSKVYEDEASKLLERAMIIEKTNKVIAEENIVEEKATKTIKEKNEEVKKANKDAQEQINKTIDLIEKEQQLSESIDAYETSKQLTSAIDSQMQGIQKTGQYSIDLIDSLIKKEHDMQAAQIRRKYETQLASKNMLEASNAQMEMDFELAKLDDETAAKRKQTMTDLETAQEDYAAKQVELAQKTAEEIENTEKENADKLKEIQKQQWENNAKFAEQTANFFIEQSEKKISQIQKESDAAQKQYDTLAQLAADGNINAKESLAEQQRIINEANQRKEKEMRRQQRIKLAESVYSTYSAKIAAGSKNALAETITETALLQQFIASLPTFESGTENTGANGRGLDGKGGFLSVLHPNERVVPKSLNEQIGSMSNEALAKMAMEYNAGKIINGTKAAESLQLAVLVNEMRDLKQVIQNKPETNIELGEITQSVMEIVKTTKHGNTHTFNRYKVRK